MMFGHPQHGFLVIQCFILVLQSLMFVGADTASDVFVKCGETARLPCKAQYKSGILYRAISWYKVANGGGFSGIVRKDLSRNIDRKYLGFNGSVELDSAIPYSLIIHNISSEDLGTYKCSLWAPLGEKNEEADVRLREVDYLQSSKEFGGEQLSFLVAIGLTILAFVIIICVISVSIKCARIRAVSQGYKKFNKLQAVENCHVPQRLYP